MCIGRINQLLDMSDEELDFELTNTPLEKFRYDIKEFWKEVVEQCAVKAWTTGMDLHNANNGAGMQARDVGSYCAKAIRNM